jgi:phage portal protein BeeE
VTVGLLERIAAARTEKRYAVDQWLDQYLLPSQFLYNGNSYPFGGVGGLNQTYVGQRIAEIVSTLPGYAAAVRGCPPAFAAQMVRALVISQARFTFRNKPSSRTPRRTFGTTKLAILEEPAPNMTTGELLARMEWHAGLAGNAYAARRGDRVRVLRPDWVAILSGSKREPDDPAGAIDSELIGYVYWNLGQHGGYQPEVLFPDDVAHWSPLPDPEQAHIGMSWITPAVREIQGDRAATEHKLKFFENGATPNMVVKGIASPDGTRLTKPQFDEIVDMIEDRHSGVANAYRTLYLTAGADATVVGSNLQQIDFKATQGTGETRIAFLSRVPAPLLGISEGLAGSSLNAGNFGMARRIFADSWVYPTLQDLCGALSTIVDVPSDAELWFDTADMPILREDAKDAADIEQVKQSTIAGYVREGFTPESAVAAVRGQDVNLLKHSGLVSVQLQPPGTTLVAKSPAPTLPGAKPPPALPPGPARDQEPDDDSDEGERRVKSDRERERELKAIDRIMKEPPRPNYPPYDVEAAPVTGDDAELDDELLERAKNDEQLHHYWTKGKGLAKWAGSPHPWTTLYHHLVKFVGPERAKRMAAQWHHEVLGRWPGEKKS